MKRSNRSASLIVSFAVAALLSVGVLSGCNQNNNTSPTTVQQSSQPVSASSIQHAIDVQNRHSDDIMNIPGVNGIAVGTDNNSAVIYVYTEIQNVSGIPAKLEDVNTKVQYIGEVDARDVNTGVSRAPMLSGYSVGNDKECAAGTISCVVQDNTSSMYYIMSNNHVFARVNAATLGEVIDQPGRYDTGCAASGQVANLSKFIPINFAKNSTNVVDCAIAEVTVTASSQTPIGQNGQAPYTPGLNAGNASIGEIVKKTGRTTGYQSSTISSINGTFRVSYGKGKTATFVNQVLINSPTFSAAGDSGSLIVDNSSNTPVALLFAGSPTTTIANPIGAVLNALGVHIVNATPTF